MISERLERLEKALAIMREKAPCVMARLPVRLRNTSNSREGWRATAKRAQLVRETTRMLIQGATNGKTFPLIVRLVYVGPRQLDDDGIASAVKSLRDGVADALGVDDRDPRVVWVPDQERGEVREYGALVEVYLG